VLIRRTAKFTHVVLPEEFHQTVFEELHVNMAHLGVNKVLGLAQQMVCWPGMAADLTNMVRKKCKCIANKTPHRTETAPMETIQKVPPDMYIVMYRDLSGHDILRYFPRLPDILRYFPIFPDILRYFTILPDILRYFPIFPDISRYFTIFPDISRYFTIFHDISRYFTIFHDISRYFTTFYDISHTR